VIDGILQKISDHVGSAPDALAVTVAARSSPYATLVSTVLSLRTRDEVCAVVTPRLLARAPDPAALHALSQDTIQELIYPTSFYRMKAGHFKSIAQDLIEKFNGHVPDTREGLMSLKGIGRKSANLILTLGFGKSAICVDTHVHRISNRLGFVKTKNPLETELALEKVLPEKWWIDVNGALIAFGRSQCVPVSPKCSSCPIRDACPRDGVGISR
jgi:endonuclease III